MKKNTKDDSEKEFEFFENAAKESAEEEHVIDESMHEDPALGYFVLIKDSIMEESEILDHSDSHYILVDKLEEIVEEENEIRQKENDRPSSLMERKHPDFRRYWKMLEEMEIKEKEIIRFGDGRISYRVEEL